MALSIYNPNNGRGGVWAQGDSDSDNTKSWALDLSGNDTILAMAGNDVIFGGAGSDHIYGGKGSDRIVETVEGNLILGDVSHPNLLWSEVDADTYNPKAWNAWGTAKDNDNLQYHPMTEGIRVSTVNTWSVLGQDLAATYGFNDERSAYVIDTHSANTYADTQEQALADVLALGVDVAVGIETLVGTQYDDAFLLQQGSHMIAVSAGAGHDWIEKASGNARIHGGEGNDTITLGTIWGSDAGIRTVEAGEGVDTVKLVSTDGLLIEGVNPSSALGRDLAQNTENGLDLWNGREGDGTGAYTVTRKMGSEAYDALQAGDYDIDSNWFATTGYQFGENAKAAGLDRAELIVNVEKVVGTAFNDAFLGRGGVDVFDGGDGNDYIDGRGGLDIFTGGLGNDTFAFTVPQEKGNGYFATITDFDMAGNDTLRVGPMFDAGFAFIEVVGDDTKVTFSPVDDATDSIATVVLDGYDWTDFADTKTEWVAANIDFA